MKKFLTFGNWNKNYLYIIFSSICLTLFKIIVGYNYYSYKMKWVTGGDYEEIISHVYIQQFLYYFLIFISAILYHKYEQNKEKKEILDKKKKKNKKLISKEKNNEILSINTQDLIYNNIYEYGYEYKKISNAFSYIIIFLYVIQEQATIAFKRYFVNFDFWMLELLAMAILNKKMFKIEIYKHQFLSIILGFIPVMLKISAIILLFMDEKNHANNKNGEQINYKYDYGNSENNNINDLKMLFVVHQYLSAIAFLIYLLIITLKAYVTISIKRIMDLKYVSLTKVLICYGGFGASLLFIFSLSSSFIKCMEGNERKDNFNYLSDYQCKVIDKNNTYIERVQLLFTQEANWKNFLIPLGGGVAFGFYKLFVLSIVLYLTPIHKSFSLPIYYFLEKMVLINNVIQKNSSFRKYNDILYWIDLSSDIIAIIAFLIYLEIIELNFWGLNNNLRKNIINRCREEFKQYNIAANEGEIESEESSTSKSRSWTSSNSIIQ